MNTKSIALIVAGLTGMLTGTAAEHLPLASAIAVAVIVGSIVGGVLYCVLRWIARRKRP